MADPNTITPEALEAMLQVGNLNNEQAMIQRQLAQADALRAPMDPHHTAVGGGLGAAAQILNGYTANKKEAAGQAQMAAAGSKLTDAQRAMIYSLLNYPQAPGYVKQGFPSSNLTSPAAPPADYVSQAQ